ncbi:MAG: hypothetical protein AAFQ98_26925, partial [Bacteroidota bacterium]
YLTGLGRKAQVSAQRKSMKNSQAAKRQDENMFHLHSSNIKRNRRLLIPAAGNNCPYRFPIPLRN